MTSDIFPPGSTLPNFLIVGAPKCGTTAVAANLATHPDVYCSRIKEPNFFTASEVRELYYRAPIISDPIKYAKLFSHGRGRKIVFEASTSYLYYPEAPSRILAALGPVKILILTRDPIERAFSHYLMDKTMGCIDVPFGEIIRNPARYPYHFSQYISTSQYATPISRYIQTFGSHNVKILAQESFLSSNSSSFTSLLDFLQLDNNLIQTHSKRHNTHKTPRLNFFSKIVNTNIYLTYGQQIPKPIRSITKRILFSNKTTVAKISESDRDLLNNIFQQTPSVHI